jgi:hypothetical protein
MRRFSDTKAYHAYLDAGSLINKDSDQEGTKVLLKVPVLRIRDVYPGSRIPDPDFYPSRIPDPGSRISDPGSRIQKQIEKRGVKKIFLSKHFFVATNFTKCKFI